MKKRHSSLLCIDNHEDEEHIHNHRIEHRSIIPRRDSGRSSTSGSGRQVFANDTATSSGDFRSSSSPVLLNAMNCWLRLSLLLCLFAGVSGHGFLSLPRSRNFVAYEDRLNEQTALDPLPEDCPECLNRGGTLARCGIINPDDTWGAHNYDHPMSAIGYPLPTNVQASYIEGQIITVEVFLSDHHKGHMVFSGCRGTEGEAPTQECFDQNRLRFVKDLFYGAPVDTNFPHRVMVAPFSHPDRKSAYEDQFSPDTSMLFRFELELPPDLNGQQVLLQWYYVESNSECMHEGYDQYPWPQKWIESSAQGEYNFNAGLVNCADILPPDGKQEVTDTSIPEQFWNCAEVSIIGKAPVVEQQKEQIEKEKTIIGYFASWQYYDRNSFAVPKNFDFTKYTRINFAFFQTNADGDIWGTDEWADPITLFGEHDWAALEGREYCSWDGPNMKTCQRHHYEDGLIYQAKAAGAEIWPSIGGWSLSDPFPAMAASEVAREKFANKCVQLIEEYGFDGIDIDWEYPGYADHSGTPEDKGNYNLLLQTIREKLDELGKRSGGKFFGLTAALPCGTSHIQNIDIETVSKYLSEFNLMTYDFFGAWSPTTGINAPLHDQSWGGEDTVGFSIDGCTKNWVAGGADPSKINIGLPFYGRSFLGATGLNQEHEGKADEGMWHEDEGSPQYFNIVEKLEAKSEWSTDQQMYSYRHEETSTQYAWYNIYGGTGFVSYDDEQAICDKTQYALTNELNGFIIWEISGDLMLDGTTPLIDAVHSKLGDPQLDCKTFQYEGTLPSPSATPTFRSTTLRPTPRTTTKYPTKRPSMQPKSSSPQQQKTSLSPSKAPTRHPSRQPTSTPSSTNVVESIQSDSTSVQIITPNPTALVPTRKPTLNPMTTSPTPKPSQVISKTKSPTQRPSLRPTTRVPTPHPTMKAFEPTPRPTPVSTNRPSTRPSSSPTRNDLNTNEMALSVASASSSSFVSTTTTTQYSPEIHKKPRPGEVATPHPITSTQSEVATPHPITSTQSEVATPRPITSTQSEVATPRPITSTQSEVATPRPITSTQSEVATPRPITSTQSAPMKGEDPIRPLSTHGAGQTQNQIRPMKKKGAKKKQKAKKKRPKYNRFPQ